MDRTTRLEDALSVFLEWQKSKPKISIEDLLRQHPDLEEYLRPMIEDPGLDAPSEERRLGEYRLCPTTNA